MKKIGFLYSPEFLNHTPPYGHPERADRLRHLINHLKQSELWDKLVHITPVPAGEESILAVHSGEYLESLRTLSSRGGGMLDDGDTFLTPNSLDVAMLAAGAVTTAIDQLTSGNIDAAFCAVRPPGHHAERDRAMGFCVINSAAVGARYAQNKYGMKRIAVLDWDVHHGNGTQHIFESDSSVLYISFHQFPFYPGTGARDETGIGDGKGYTLNIPLAVGSGEEEFLSAFDEVVPTIRGFQPELLIISAGFDAHKDDPLGGLRLTHESFGKLTDIVKEVAPIVSVLEGGYNLESLSSSCEEHLRSLMA